MPRPVPLLAGARRPPRHRPATTSSESPDASVGPEGCRASRTRSRRPSRPTDRPPSPARPSAVDDADPAWPPGRSVSVTRLAHRASPPPGPRSRRAASRRRARAGLGRGPSIRKRPVGPRVVVAAVAAVQGNGLELVPGRAGRPAASSSRPDDREAAVQLDARGPATPDGPTVTGNDVGRRPRARLRAGTPRARRDRRNARRARTRPLPPDGLLSFRWAQEHDGLGHGLAGLAVDHDPGDRRPRDLEVELETLDVGDRRLAARDRLCRRVCISTKDSAVRARRRRARRRRRRAWSRVEGRGAERVACERGSRRPRRSHEGPALGAGTDADDGFRPRAARRGDRPATTTSRSATSTVVVSPSRSSTSCSAIPAQAGGAARAGGRNRGPRRTAITVTERGPRRQVIRHERAVVPERRLAPATRTSFAGGSPSPVRRRTVSRRGAAPAPRGARRARARCERAPAPSPGPPRPPWPCPARTTGACGPHLESAGRHATDLEGPRRVGLRDRSWRCGCSCRGPRRRRRRGSPGLPSTTVPRTTPPRPSVIVPALVVRPAVTRTLERRRCRTRSACASRS